MASNNSILRFFMGFYKKSFLYSFVVKIDLILAFFIGLLIFTFSAFFSFSPPNQSYEKHDNTAKLEAKDFILTRFDYTGINMLIRGSNALQYADREVYYNFIGNRLNDNQETESLEGKEVVHIGDNYDFIQGIHYTKSPYTSFFSERGVYNTATEIFTGQGNFLVENESMTTTGKNIIYDKKTDTTIAQDITTKIFKASKNAN